MVCGILLSGRNREKAEPPIGSRPFVLIEQHSAAVAYWHFDVTAERLMILSARQQDRTNESARNNPAAHTHANYKSSVKTKNMSDQYLKSLKSNIDKSATRDPTIGREAASLVTA